LGFGFELMRQKVIAATTTNSFGLETNATTFSCLLSLLCGYFFSMFFYAYLTCGSIIVLAIFGFR